MKAIPPVFTLMSKRGGRKKAILNNQFRIKYKGRTVKKIEAYHMAINEVVTSGFGINPAKNTRISKGPKL